MSRTTSEGPSGNQPDDGECVVCGDAADGIDARTLQPMCRRCASIRADGGDISPGRRCVTSTVSFGGLHVAVATPGDDVNHLSGEVSIEVSGASTDYPHPTRLQREIEAAVLDALENYDEKVSDDVDRGDGIETDGGVDLRLEANLEAAAENNRDVEYVDGALRLADDATEATVDVPLEDEVVTDGVLLTGGSRYHVVCSDCTFEDLKRERHQAASAVDEHRDDEPSHDVRFEEVRGR